MMIKSITIKQTGNQIKFYDNDKLIQTCNTAYCVRMMRDVSIHYNKEGYTDVIFKTEDIKSCSKKI